MTTEFRVGDRVRFHDEEVEGVVQETFSLNGDEYARVQCDCCESNYLCFVEDLRKAEGDDVT